MLSLSPILWFIKKTAGIGDVRICALLCFAQCEVKFSKRSYICLSAGNERALQDKQYFYISNL